MMRVLLFIIALQSAAFSFACASSGSQVTQKPAKERATGNLKWTDSEWSLTPLDQLPSVEDARRIRCGNAVCWIWDEESVWVLANEDSWRLFHRDAKARIHSVYLASVNSGWIAKDRILYRTDDAGATLKQVFPAPGTEDILISSVFFANENHGWAAGVKLDQMRKDDPVVNTDVDRGRLRVSSIYETRDGGQTWSEAKLPRFSGFLVETSLSEKGIGIAGHRRNLLFTNDSGTNWIDFQKYFPKLNPDERGNFVSAFFSGDRGWLVFAGFEFEVWQTTDKGASWQKSIWRIETESSDTASNVPTPRFVFVDDQHALFVYNHTDDCEVFKTSDGGKTWSKIPIEAAGEERFYDVALQSATKGFLVSNKGVYKVTFNR